MELSRFSSPAHLCAIAALLVSALALSGCVSLFGGRTSRADRSSSVVAFLYPDEANPLPSATIPTLRLPLRVGIAFVPSGTAHPPYAQSGITEAQKAALLNRVAGEFKGLDFISGIEVLPTNYLRPGGGFANLDQLRHLFSLDVIALVAYDQVQYTNENRLALTYWTIVGAYLFHGNSNDTHTLMESAVYDLESRHLLFRAPGVSRIEGHTAMVKVPEELRADSSRSFDTATDDLIKNLRTQLDSFQDRLKRAPDQVARIEHRPGYRGGGSTSAWFALGLAFLTAAGARFGRGTASSLP